MSLRPYDAPPALRGAPAALANCYDPDDSVAAFIPDEVAGSRAVTQHLIEHGHRDIVMLTGTSDVDRVRAARAGFRRGDGRGRAAGARPGHRPAGRSTRGTRAPMHVLTATEPRPTAIVCANDRVRDRGGARGRPAGAVRARRPVGGRLRRRRERGSVPGAGPDHRTAAAPRDGGAGHAGGAGAACWTTAPAGRWGPTPTRAPRTLLDCPLVVRDSVAPPPLTQARREPDGQPAAAPRRRTPRPTPRGSRPLLVVDAGTPEGLDGGLALPALEDVDPARVDQIRGQGEVQAARCAPGRAPRPPRRSRGRPSRSSAATIRCPLTITMSVDLPPAENSSGQARSAVSQPTARHRRSRCAGLS